jgi:hypothetical protein
MRILNVVNIVIVGFNFKVSNTRKDLTVCFHILNMAKRDLMYNEGMKIAMHSEREQSKGWFRDGTNIQYVANENRSEGRQWYVLSFSYEFLYDDDTVSMAFAEPYTYTDILKDIALIESKLTRHHFYSRKALCTTVGGCTCEVITLTSNKQTTKKTVIFTARVHAGETVSS